MKSVPYLEENIISDEELVGEGGRGCRHDHTGAQGVDLLVTHSSSQAFLLLSSDVDPQSA